MDQETLRYAVAAMVIALFAWMAGRNLYLRSRGVKVNAVTERNSNAMQRALILGVSVFDLYLLLRAPFPVLDAWLRTAPAPFPFLALGAMAAGGLIIVVGQSGMGTSWRIGVPQKESHVDRLVKTGLYKFSRNPVYLGIMIFLVGAVLAAPGPFAGLALIVGAVGLTAIIRQEERYLSDRFGAHYEEYKRRVRRWI